MQLDILINKGRIINYNKIINADIGILNGKIYLLGQNLINIVKAKEIINAENKLIFPGIIDPHTHFDLKLPTATSNDNFYTGSIAAAYGGVTTIIDFTDPDAENIINALDKRLQLAKDSVIDYSLHSVIVNYSEKREKEIKEIINQGITSFKIFTTYSESNRDTNNYQLYKLFKLSEKLNFLILIHAEDDAIIQNTKKYYKQKNKYNYKYLSSIRPDIAESTAINTIGYYLSQIKANVYIVHLSSKKGLDIAKQYIDKGYNLKIETCPHYLTLTKECFKSSDGYLYALCPPLRDKKDNLALIEGIKDEYIKHIGTDHCPFCKKEKKLGIRNLDNMPYGISGVETNFYILYNVLHLENNIPLTKLVEISSYNNAKTFGLKNKGSIEIGKDADLFIFNPEKVNKLSYKNLHSNIDYSIYKDYNIKGDIETVISRGEIIIKNKEFKARKRKGKFIKRMI